MYNLVKVVEGFEVEEFDGGLIFLNVDLSEPSLVNEGITRDVIRRIQSMRKDLGLNYDAKIKTYVNSTNEILLSAISEYKDLLSSETLTTSLETNIDYNTNSFTKWTIKAVTGESLEFFANT